MNTVYQVRKQLSQTKIKKKNKIIQKKQHIVLELFSYQEYKGIKSIIV